MTSVSRGIDRIEVTFDEPNLVANAGLLFVATLVVRLRLEGLINDMVDRSDRVGGALPGGKVLTLVHAMVAGAELMFQILTEREEKASVATASNLPFSEWGRVIGDPRLVAAIVDRLTFNAHIIETGTESFRLRSTRAKRATKPKS